MKNLIEILQNKIQKKKNTIQKFNKKQKNEVDIF